MNSANAASTLDGTWTPPAILRGTARGLEIVVAAGAAAEAIAAAVATRLAEAPAFFRGNDVRVRVEDGPLPAGCLARLEDLARTFELRIVEVAQVTSAAIPRPAGLWAAGTSPASQPSLPLVEPSPAPARPVEPPPEPAPAAPEPSTDQLELALRNLMRAEDSDPEISIIEAADQVEFEI